MEIKLMLGVDESFFKALDAVSNVLILSQSLKDVELVVKLEPKTEPKPEPEPVKKAKKAKAAPDPVEIEQGSVEVPPAKSAEVNLNPTPDDPVLRDEIMKTIRQNVRTYGKALKALLSEFGVEASPDLKPEQLVHFAARLKEILSNDSSAA